MGRSCIHTREIPVLENEGFFSYAGAPFDLSGILDYLSMRYEQTVVFSNLSYSQDESKITIKYYFDNKGL